MELWKTTSQIRTKARAWQMAALSFWICLAAGSLNLRADGPAPPGGGPDWLDAWSFWDTDAWHSDLDHAPRSFTNLSWSFLGNGGALTLDSTNQAWLNYNCNEANGTTNLSLGVGSVTLWFAGSWASTNQGGTGPGEWGRLIEVGSHTTNASYGFWSLYLDPSGTHIYLSSQTNDGWGDTYLTAPISFQTNDWHFLALTYTATNAALYIDGALATNGPPVAYLPNASVRSNGWWIGSASNGLSQAHGMFDDIATYNFPLSSSRIANTYYVGSLWYYGNPLNDANLSSGPSEPSVEWGFRAVTGSGRLTPIGTNIAGCT